MSQLKAIFRGFLTALLATGLTAIVSRFVFAQLLGFNLPVMVYLVPVMAAAWIGGRTAGFWATILSATAGSFLFMERAGLETLPRQFQLRVLLLIAIGVLLSWLLESLHSARRRLEDRQRALEQEIVERRKAESAERKQRERLATEMRRRAEAEMALREREERTRMAVESANIGTFDFNPATGERKWSERAKIMFGLSPDDNVNNISFLDRLHPDDRQRAEHAVRQALDPNGNGVYEIECRLNWPAGTTRWFIAKGQAFFEGELPHRRPVRFIGTVLETTERKQAELALRQAEEKFRVLATNAPVGIFQTDSQGRCLFVNRTWCETAGAEPEDALGDGWQRFVHPDDLPRIAAEWEAATHERRGHVAEFRFLNQCTGARWAIVSATPVIDATGLVTGYVGTTVDVTERKAIEDVVRASEARLRGILDNTTAVIYLKDLDGQYLLVNRRWQELFGNHNGQSPDHSPQQPFPPELADLLHANDIDVIETGSPCEFEETVSQADGPHTYITVKFPIKDSSGKVSAVGGISTDITDRKKALQALEAEQELLHHTIEMQDQERQIVTYEIHDGLVQYATGALMQLEGLRDRVQSETIAEHIENIVGILRKTVDEGRRIINGIHTPVLDDCGVVAAVQQLIEEEDRAHVHVDFIKDDGFGRMASNIEVALYHITQEALTNAYRHSHSSKVRVELGRHGDRVRLEVRDWGVGFAPLTSSNGVHGLRGMTERARIAGGQCKIESAPGKGTRIAVDLPYRHKI